MKKKKNKNNFMLDTDWLIQQPIDFEHKKYILLSYLQKIDKLLEENKLYPHFTEISLHLASIQTLIKEGVTLYTEKKFDSVDDELLLKDLMVKPVKKLSDKEIVELEKIVKFAATKFFDFFNVIKSYWNIYYDCISFSLRKNKKNVNLGYGFFTFDSKTGERYVWEYNIDIMDLKNNEYKLKFNLIYSDKKGNLTIQQILNNFSKMEKEQIKIAPIFSMKTSNEFPLNETMLPIFKRKILTYTLQTIKIQNLKSV